MHMVIRAIVYAENKNEALGKAKQIFDGLTENQDPFDYYTTFDEDGRGVAGKDRWGKLPVVVVEADSPKGKKLIEDGMKFTREEFLRNLSRVKKVLGAHDDETIFRTHISKDTDLDMFKHACYNLGMYRGPSVWLYSDDGEGIREPEHLKDVLEKWECLYERKGEPNPHASEKIYVVPADVHY